MRALAEVFGRQSLRKFWQNLRKFWQNLPQILAKPAQVLAKPAADFGKAWKSGEHEAYEKEVNEKYEFAGVEPNNMDVNDVLGAG